LRCANRRQHALRDVGPEMAVKLGVSVLAEFKQAAPAAKDAFARQVRDSTFAEISCRRSQRGAASFHDACVLEN